MLSDADFRKKLSRINAEYFAYPDRIFSLKKGESLMHEDAPSTRLYLLLVGKIIAYRAHRDADGKPIPGSFYEVFRADAGSYIGVQSFFSGAFRCSCEIIAETDIEVAFIDDTVPAVEPEKYGSLTEQFVPAMLHELALRNARVFEHAAEKEAAMRRMHRSEMAATLGQLAAGVAHELNNAIGVLTRKADFVSEFLENDLRSRRGKEAEMFLRGRDDAAVYSSEEIRRRAREYERYFKISQSSAKILARIAPDADAVRALDKKIVRHIEELVPFWEIGRDIRDMKHAARHATAVVRSVKILGGGNIRREPGTDVRVAVSEAISLLRTNLRDKTLRAELGDEHSFPKIYGDMTELVQVCVNLIKNSCDALDGADTPNPTVAVTLSCTDKDVSVAVADNGPGVPVAIRDKIFRPDFSTKKSGLSFGLGIGLAIVRRIVDEYKGSIKLESVPGDTVFTVTLPIGEA